MDFCPSVYEHAARVIGRTPWELSRDGGLLAAGHIEAFRLYSHRPVVVGIDIYNLEAEAYGAIVRQASGNGIPAVTPFPVPVWTIFCLSRLSSLPRRGACPWSWRRRNAWREPVPGLMCACRWRGRSPSRSIWPVSRPSCRKSPIGRSTCGRPWFILCKGRFVSAG